jgi:two-component system, chemotaxis family, chemotaxis protein CheY
MKLVLVADDNSTVRKAVRDYLTRKEGLSVCEAVDGVEAIEKAKELRPDLIVLDLTMPNLNGAQAASIIKHEMPEVPIILLTIQGSAANALTTAVGIDIVLDKCEGIRNLARHVESLITAAEKCAASA